MIKETLKNWQIIEGCEHASKCSRKPTWSLEAGSAIKSVAAGVLGRQSDLSPTKRILSDYAYYEWDGSRYFSSVRTVVEGAVKD